MVVSNGRLRPMQRWRNPAQRDVAAGFAVEAVPSNVPIELADIDPAGLHYPVRAAVFHHPNGVHGDYDKSGRDAAGERKEPNTRKTT